MVRLRRFIVTVSQTDCIILLQSRPTTNPLRGAPRIHGELLKLDIEISQATVAKYMVRRRRDTFASWRSFLSSQAQGPGRVPQHLLNLRRLPHGQGSLPPTLCDRASGSVSRPGSSADRVNRRPGRAGHGRLPAIERELPPGGIEGSHQGGRSRPEASKSNRWRLWPI